MLPEAISGLSHNLRDHLTRTVWLTRACGTPGRSPTVRCCTPKREILPWSVGIGSRNQLLERATFCYTCPDQRRAINRHRGRDLHLGVVSGKVGMKRKLSENWKRVEQRIADACHRANRSPQSVKLVAITKYASLDVIHTMVDLGFTDLGESRVQELTKRAAAVNEWLGRRARDIAAGAKPRPRWHMVGHLQRNKVKAVIPWIDLIHSVDSLRLAEEIDAQSKKLGRVTAVLLQVNAGDEQQKSGVAVAAATHLAEQVASLQHIELRGLMAMAPLTDDESQIRYVFGRTRELFEEIVGERICGPEFKELSLGMSQDFECGIEAGATYVRIGTALFEGIELAAPYA